LLTPRLACGNGPVFWKKTPPSKSVDQMLVSAEADPAAARMRAATPVASSLTICTPSTAFVAAH
jgi:hypothetical protein